MSSIESNNQSLNNILEKLVSVRRKALYEKEKQSWTRRLSKTHDYAASKSRPFCTYGKWRVYRADGTVFNGHRDNRNGSNSQGSYQIN